MGEAQDGPEPDLWPGLIAPTAGGRGGRKCAPDGAECCTAAPGPAAARVLPVPTVSADRRRQALQRTKAERHATRRQRGPGVPRAALRRRRTGERWVGGDGATGGAYPAGEAGRISHASEVSGTRPQDRMGRRRRRGSGAPRRLLRHTGKVERGSEAAWPARPSRQAPTERDTAAHAAGLRARPAPAGGSTPHNGNSVLRIPYPRN